MIGFSDGTPIRKVVLSRESWAEVGWPGNEYNYMKNDEEFKLLLDILNDKNKTLLYTKHESLLIRDVCHEMIKDNLNVELKYI